MPVSENQAELANDNVKTGLTGRAAGPVEALGTTNDDPTALGDITPRSEN